MGEYFKKSEVSHKFEKGKNIFIKWVKEHKTELIIIGVTAVGTVLVVKNWDLFKGVFKSPNSKSISSPTINNKAVVEKAIVPVIPSDITDNLTGNMLTATKLGDKTSCSAQTINKRIVAAGLATKLPHEGYSLTEAGSLLGEHRNKTTRAGYPFTNIEWDEKILEIIFSAEELLEIADWQERVREILGGFAA